MLPASTSRRNAEMMSGVRISTPRTIPPITRMLLMELLPADLGPPLKPYNDCAPCRPLRYAANRRAARAAPRHDPPDAVCPGAAAPGRPARAESVPAPR